VLLKLLVKVQNQVWYIKAKLLSLSRLTPSNNLIDDSKQELEDKSSDIESKYQLKKAELKAMSREIFI